MEDSKKLAYIVGKNIQKRRKVLGMTQDSLAELVGIGQQSLSRMERGGIAPRFERLASLATTLQCSVTDLFHEDASAPAMPQNPFGDILRDLTPEQQQCIISLATNLAQIFRAHTV